MMKTIRMPSSLFLIFALISPIANADMVVIVSNSNGNTSLNKDDVERIFLGKLSTFPNNATAIPLDNTEAMKSVFYQKVANKNMSQLRAYWSKMVFTSGGQPPKEVGSDSDVVDIVAKNPNTVGYIDKAHVTSAVHVVFTVP